MRLRHLILVVVLTAVVGTGLLVQHRYSVAQAAVKPVDLTLKDVNGKTVKLSDYRGKVVVVDVWATWCPYCVREIPYLSKMQEAAEKDKTSLQIIGISVDRNKNDVKDFLKENEMSYPVVYGDAKALKPLGEVYGLPTKFIINDKGVVVDKLIGAVKKEDLQKKLDKYLPKDEKE